MAEGEGRLVPLPVDEGVAVVRADLGDVGELVERRQLRLGPGRGQRHLAAGVDLAEEDPRQGVAALHAEVPGHEDGRHVVLPLLHGEDADRKNCRND